MHLPQVVIRHKILRKISCLKRRNITEIRLIVCKAACHQFKIWTVLIGQISIPCLAEITAAPGPLLFTRRNMMVGNMEQARFHAVIITADKIEIAFSRHIRGRYRQIVIT